jgi:hypothetical protein
MVIMVFTIVSLTGNISFAQGDIQMDSAAALTSGAKSPMPQVGGSDKISLDLKGMDSIEVIKMLAAKGNLNIVLSNDVKGCSLS